MLTFKNSIVPLMSAFVVSTALVGFAQADEAHPCGADGDGDKPIVECPEANAEAAAEAPAKGEDMVGDFDGDKPLTASQQVEGSAPTEAARSDLDGAEPTNQPVVDTTDGND